MAALGEGEPPAHSLELGWAFFGTFQGRPHSPPFTLGGNGTGHTSHRKLTSKERVREECWLVPFPGLVCQALRPFLCTALGGHIGTTGAAVVILPVMPRATWSEGVASTQAPVPGLL